MAEVTQATIDAWLAARPRPDPDAERAIIARVLWWRYCDSERRTLVWIATELDTYRERVRLLEARGLRSLRIAYADGQRYDELRGTRLDAAIFG